MAKNVAVTVRLDLWMFKVSSVSVCEVSSGGRGLESVGVIVEIGRGEAFEGGDVDEFPLHYVINVPLYYYLNPLRAVFVEWNDMM